MGSLVESTISSDQSIEQTAPRSHSRFFCEKGRWYFQTREGYDIGPYQDMDEARLALEYFITNIRWPNAQQLHALTRRAGDDPH